VKAFEVEKGRLVYLSDEDFETAEAQTHGGRTIDIRVFVRYEEIDPIFFERTYYLEPGAGGEKVYALLVRSMEESGLVAGIGTIRLELRASNRGARRFYERLGFQEVARVPEYYGGVETAVRMARDIRRGLAGPVPNIRELLRR